MKILRRGTYENVFPMEVVCRRVEDEYGFAYGSNRDFCGSVLSVDEKDIEKHKWFKYPEYSGVDYGVTCPVCGNFIVISEELLPRMVKDTANEVKLN